MAKVNLTEGVRVHRTVGAISVEMIADKVEIDLAPDLMPLGKAITAALRNAVRGITARSERDGHRLFNNLGKFVNTIFARQDAPGQWSIRAILNRKNPARSGEVMARLLELLPVLRNPGELARDSGVIAATREIVASMVTVRKAA